MFRSSLRVGRDNALRDVVMRTIGVSPIALRIVSVTGRAISASSFETADPHDYRRDHINRVAPSFHATS
jgi:hypothetical protein